MKINGNLKPTHRKCTRGAQATKENHEHGRQDIPTYRHEVTECLYAVGTDVRVWSLRHVDQSRDGTGSNDGFSELRLIREAEEGGGAVPLQVQVWAQRQLQGEKKKRGTNGEVGDKTGVPI